MNSTIAETANATVTAATAMMLKKQQFRLWATTDLAIHREKVMAIVPHVTGGLSMLGSVATAYQIYVHRKKGPLKSYHYIMLLMAAVDFVASFCYALSTYAVPFAQLQYTPLRPDRYGAIGNHATCAAQGFGIQFGITVLFLNLLLTLHYVAVIRYRMRERQLKVWIKGALVLCLLAGLALSVPFLFVDGYNFMHCLPSWCWIAPNPEHCAMDQSMPECQDRAKRWRNVAYFAPMWICVGLIGLGQAIIFYAVRQAQLSANKWRNSFSSSEDLDAKVSDAVKKQQKRQLRNLRRRADSYQQIGRQSLLYMSVMLLCWMPMTIATNVLHDRRIWFLTNDKFWLPLLVVTVQPLQGFLNFCVYNHRCIRKQMGVRLETLRAALCCSRDMMPEAKSICEPRSPEDLVVGNTNASTTDLDLASNADVASATGVFENEEFECGEGEEDFSDVTECEAMYEP